MHATICGVTLSQLLSLGGLPADATPLPRVERTQIPPRHAEVDWEQPSHNELAKKKPRLPPRSPVPDNTEWEGNSNHAVARIRPTPIIIEIKRKEELSTCLDHGGADFQHGITARELMLEYNDNELAADLKHKNKCTLISGFLADISSDLMGNPYLLLHTGSGVLWVQLFFDDSQVADLTKVRKSWYFSGIGIVKGRSLGQVVLTDCWGQVSSKIPE